MEKASIKKELLEKCREQLAARRKGVQKILDNVAVSLNEETKSSAGDKHETGRAMLQLERENAGKQIAEIEKLEAVLLRVSLQVSIGPVHLGSVAVTSQAAYFLSIPSGELIVNGVKYYAIGLGSPMGQLLLGKQEGDEVGFRGTVLDIQSVF